jgi:hypothetical protein
MFATPVSRFTPRLSILVLALALVASSVACSGDDPNEPPSSPLEGLPAVVASDSLGNLPPGVAAASGPGYFRGTVLGESAPGAGNDSLQTAPRVAGAVVTAYPVLSGSGASVEIGDAAASVTTGADGRFTLPTLPGGPYVVTIVPPAGSPYTGVQVSAPVASPTSHEHPWWIVLWDPTN